MHQLHRSVVRVPLAALAVLLIGAGSAARAENARLSSVKIDNFGIVDDHYYRGAQPTAADYPDLAALGVKTVIDLTRDGRDDEKGLVEAAGMTFIRIPLTTTDAPTGMDITQFLSVVTDPANQPVYVHCQGGRHRTGTMTAIYRMAQDGWSPARAYEEMKQYRFEGFPGHPELKKFVLGYKPSAGAPQAIQATSASATP